MKIVEAVVAGLALVAPMIVAEFAHRDVPPTQVNARDDEALTGLGVDDIALERMSASVAGTFELERQGEFERPVLCVTGRQDSTVGYRDAWATPNLIDRLPR